MRTGYKLRSHEAAMTETLNIQSGKCEGVNNISIIEYFRHVEKETKQKAALLIQNNNRGSKSNSHSMSYKNHDTLITKNKVKYSHCTDCH